MAFIVVRGRTRVFGKILFLFAKTTHSYVIFGGSSGLLRLPHRQQSSYSRCNIFSPVNQIALTLLDEYFSATVSNG